ncbi:hypothetical protein GOP47_0015349 [Adiantum capillus-veneris]|uniref:Uncharacterized protein n=1 Tax=Adiantum capillus-veneris TaxID=13818 RepID=A0A9D4UKH4_ADICA|nr:hypothetical protein GOP47_0015349 [Adiantum capillus-veneris]
MKHMRSEVKIWWRYGARCKITLTGSNNRGTSHSTGSSHLERGGYKTPHHKFVIFQSHLNPMYLQFTIKWANLSMCVVGHPPPSTTWLLFWSLDRRRERLSISKHYLDKDIIYLSKKDTGATTSNTPLH